MLFRIHFISFYIQTILLHHKKKVKALSCHLMGENMLFGKYFIMSQKELNTHTLNQVLAQPSLLLFLQVCKTNWRLNKRLLNVLFSGDLEGAEESLQARRMSLVQKPAASPAEMLGDVAKYKKSIYLSKVKLKGIQ